MNARGDYFALKKREDQSREEQLNTEPEIRQHRPFDQSNDDAFDDFLYGRTSEPTFARPKVKRAARVKADRPRKKVWKKVLAGIGISLLSLCLAVILFWQWLISGAETNVTVPSTTLPTVPPLTSEEPSLNESSSLEETEETTEGTVADRPTIPQNTDYLHGIEYNKDVTNILIIGTDSRDETGLTFERSDTMMLLTIDKVNDRIKLTSFQRDMLVYLPGQPIPVKLNEANLYGPEVLIETINQNFLLDISDYVMVNIMDAENLVDAVGGMEIYIEDDPQVLEYLNACIIEQNVMYEGWDDRSNWVPTIHEGGLLQLNGRQTIAYARMRKLDSDYQRMGRQREVMMKGYEKAKNANVVQLIRLAKAGFDMVSTNMSQTELTGMLLSLLPAMTADVEQFQVPINGYFWSDSNGPWVNRVNFNLMIPAIHEFVYDERITSFVPVPLVPYTPMEKVPVQYWEMPASVLSGTFKGISYVGRYGWSGDGSTIDVSGGAAILPTITPDPRPSSSANLPTTEPIASPTPVETSTELPTETTTAPTTAVPTNTPVPATPTLSPTTAPSQEDVVDEVIDPAA